MMKAKIKELTEENQKLSNKQMINTVTEDKENKLMKLMADDIKRRREVEILKNEVR